MKGRKENGTRSEKDLRVYVIKIMLHHLRTSIHKIKDMDIDVRSRISSP